MSSLRNTVFETGFGEDETAGVSQGPISQQLLHREYLEDHKVPQMLESLMACLMMERPEDMHSYLDAKLETIKSVGPENVDWETFVYPLHPARDPVRQQLVKDGNANEPSLPSHTGCCGDLEAEEEVLTSTEWKDNKGLGSCTGYGGESSNRGERKKEAMIGTDEKEEVAEEDSYKSDVFLTEPVDD